MNRILTVGICIVFVIALAGFAISFTPNESLPVAEQPTTMTPYEDRNNGYALAYPAGLDILEYTDTQAAIGTLIEGGIDGIVDVRIEVIEGKPGETLVDAAARQLRNLCDADGPASSFSCVSLESVQPFMATGGASGYEVYLKGELRELASGAVTPMNKGPYYVFPMQTGATGTKVLIIHAPLNKSADEADTATIRSIADSVRLLD